MGLFSGKCTSAVRLDGKIAVVTGSNTGIGKVTAMDLFKRGAYVIMACRNVEKANEAAKEIAQLCKNEKNVGKLEVAELNLSSLTSVKRCALQILEKQNRIDLLINNAGVMCCPYSKTEEGYEMQFGTNHLGHFLLTMLLLPKIIQSAPARIVNVASLAHIMGSVDFQDINWEKRTYSSMGAYQQSKLCNILFTKELGRRLEDANIKGVTVYALHPGVIATELGRHLDSTYFWGLRWIWSTILTWFIKTPEQGAQTTIYCVVDEQAGKESGLYYSDCKITQPSKKAQNMKDAEKLWKTSLKFVGLKEDYDPFKL